MNSTRRAVSLWPSFEAPASGGFLRMRSHFAARFQTLMVRSPPKAGVSNHEAKLVDSHMRLPCPHKEARHG